MQITAVQHIEDCLDGSFIKEISLSTAVSKAIILYLATQQGAKLQYYPDFARPFFKLTYNKGSYIKGVEGNSTMRAVWWHCDEDEQWLRLALQQAANDRAEKQQ